jgi:hypothetical protein
MAAPGCADAAGDPDQRAEPTAVAEGHPSQIDQQHPDMAGDGRITPGGQAISCGKIQRAPACTSWISSPPPLSRAPRRPAIGLAICRLGGQARTPAAAHSLASTTVAAPAGTRSSSAGNRQVSLAPGRSATVRAGVKVGCRPRHGLGPARALPQAPAWVADQLARRRAGNWSVLSAPPPRPDLGASLRRRAGQDRARPRPPCPGRRRGSQDTHAGDRPGAPAPARPGNPGRSGPGAAGSAGHRTRLEQAWGVCADRCRAAPAADAVHAPVVPRDRCGDVPVPSHRQVGGGLDHRKLGVSSRSQAVTRSRDLGLLER